MSALRCLQCHAALTETEAAAGACPECAAPLSGALADLPAAAASPAGPARRPTRFAFLAGLAVGVLLAAAGATAAWRVWGPAPVSVDTAGGPAPADTEPGASRPAADEQVRQAAAAVQKARVALQEAENQQADVDRELAAAQARLKAARDQAAVLDKELADRTARLAERDRALAAKKAQLADLDRAIAAKAGRPAAPPVGPAAAGGLAAPVPPPAARPKAKGAFARDWLVLGPFPDPGRTGHNTAFSAETGRVDPTKEYPGAAGQVRWQAHASPADYVDLAAALGTRDPAVGYAACWVRASGARRVVLSLGSKDGIKVWMNGKLVADRPVSRAAAPGQDRVGCDLAAGWNEVRVKVTNAGGPWGFYLEARDPTTDRPLAGLEYRTTRPDSKGKK
jgi:hypothetical protein